MWKVSRFGRTRRDWYVHADRLEVAGGRLESATEGFDAASSVGKFTRGMLVELAAFESDRIGDVWKEVHERRVRDGYAPNGKPKAGYVYDAEQGLHVPDPEFGPVLGRLLPPVRRWGVRLRARARPQRARASAPRRAACGLTVACAGSWTRVSRRGSCPIPRRAAPRATRAADRRGHMAGVPAGTRRQVQPGTAHRSESVPALGAGPVCEVRGHDDGGPVRRAATAKYRCKTAKEQGPEACAGGYVMASYVNARRCSTGCAPSPTTWRPPRRPDQGGRQAAGPSRARRRAAAREVTRLEAALVKIAQREAEGEMDAATYRTARDNYRSRLEDSARGTGRGREVGAAAQVSPAALRGLWSTSGTRCRSRAGASSCGVWWPASRSARGVPGPHVRVVAAWEQ